MEEIIRLYLLHKFIKNEISISKVLPDFLIEWLSFIKMMSSEEELIKDFKKNCYIQIAIYLISTIGFILAITE